MAIGRKRNASARQRSKTGGTARRATPERKAARSALPAQQTKRPKPSWSVPADTPTRVAVAGVSEALRKAMLDEQPGVEAGTDPEHLHRYRVALRRARTLFAQLRRSLPAKRVAKLRDELVWLAEITTHVRDMDVYLADWPAYRREVPAARRKHLAPLHGYLVARRQRLRSILLRALQSDRYKDLMGSWAALERRLRKHPGRKRKPIGEVAGQRLEHLRLCVLEQAGALSEDSPPLVLHELRKTCKKLRYLSEFCRGLLSDRALRQLVSHLKDLQDALGRMHDLYVHHAALDEFRKVLEREAPAETQQAMEQMLDHLLAKRHGAYGSLGRQLQDFTALLQQPRVLALFDGAPATASPGAGGSRSARLPAESLRSVPRPAARRGKARP